jgi:outer membrane protein assembly factor BamB
MPRRGVMTGFALGAVVALTGLMPAVAAVGPADWPAYLAGPGHSSYNASQTAVTTANVGSLTMKWNFVGDQPTQKGQPKPAYTASPTVADGAVYIGSRTGWFYKLNESTGQELAKVFIGFQPGLTCTAGGVISTATVAKDPSDGQDTVYVGGPDGFLYALRATDLSVKWRSVIAIPSSKISDYFQWSSPTVSGGKVFIGVSSHCDDPLVQAGLISYDQATGKRLATYFDVPKGAIGGSVWSSAAAGTKHVFITTGNGKAGVKALYGTESIIELNTSNLAKVASFRPPSSQRHFDSDFGASPTMFGSLVGACNKNGIFYALHAPSMKLAWERRVALSPGDSGRATCIAAAAYNGKALYVGATATSIGGKSFAGSIRELNPANGKIIWQTGLPNGVLGAPTLDGAGVLAVGTYGTGSPTPNAVYLINASNGHILRTISTTSPNFSQNTFADGMFFTANQDGVDAWGF